MAIALVQSKDNRHTYNSPSTSITVTLDSAATAGNLLISAVSIDKASGTITVPSGFSLVHKGEGGNSSGALAFKIAAGGETAIQWSWTATEEGNAWVGEYSGLASSNVLDQAAENETYLATATNSISTGTTGTTTQADELALAVFAADSGNSVGSSRSWTNSFSSLFESPVPSESGNPFLAIATKTLSSTGTVETTVSHSGSDECWACVATFKAAATSSSSSSAAAWSSSSSSHSSESSSSSQSSSSSSTSSSSSSMSVDQLTLNSGTDTYIDSLEPAVDHSTSNPVLVDGENPVATTLLKWDLSSVPAGITVISAKVRLYLVDATTGSYPIYALLRDWTTAANYTYYDGSSAAWTTAGSLSAGNDHDSSVAVTGGIGGTPANNWYEFDLNATGLAALQDWVDGARANYGFCVCGKGGTTDGIDISSFEDATNKPELVITYIGGSSSSSSATGFSSSSSSRSSSSSQSSSSSSQSSSSSAPPSAYVWTAYNDCGHADNAAQDTDTENVTNFEWQDSGNLVNFATGATVATISYGTGGNTGTGGGTDDGQTAPVYPPNGTDAYNEFYTNSDGTPAINFAGISYTASDGGNFTVTLGGLDNTKTYTLCCTGIRGNSGYNRWTQYTVGAVQAGYTNESSEGSGLDDRDKVIASGASTTFKAGDNYDNGYVAKWSGLQPTSTSITLTVTGVQVTTSEGTDTANKGYLSALKLSEEGETSSSSSSGSSSSSSSSSADDWSSSSSSSSSRSSSSSGSSSSSSMSSSATPLIVSLQNGTDGYTGCEDTYCNAAATGVNQDGTGEVTVDPDPDFKTILMRWTDFGSLPAGATITAVQLRVYCHDASTNTYPVYECLRPWVETEATDVVYSTGNSWGASCGTLAGTDYDIYNLADTGTMPTANQYYTISFNFRGIAAFQAWADGGTNNGIIVAWDGVQTSGMGWRDSEYATVAQRPELIISYDLPQSSSSSSETAWSSSSSSKSSSSSQSSSSSSMSSSSSAPPSAYVWTAYNDCGDDQNTAYDTDTTNVTNFGALDAGGNLVNFATGATVASISYGTGGNEGTGGGTDDGQTAPVYPPNGTDAYNEFYTNSDGTPAVNIAGISYTTSDGGNFTVTLGGLDNSKTYTLVATGIRGNSTYNRWTQYTVGAVQAGYSNDSSAGSGLDDRDKVIINGASTTFKAGDNLTNGYVAKWSGLQPTSTSITLTVTGVQVTTGEGTDTANKGYLSALKLSEEGEASSSSSSGSSSSSSSSSADDWSSSSSSTSSSSSATDPKGEYLYCCVFGADVHEGHTYFQAFLSYVKNTLGLNPEFVALAGDNARNGTNYLSNQRTAIDNTLGSSIRLWAVPGNHDSQDSNSASSKAWFDATYTNSLSAHVSYAGPTGSESTMWAFDVGPIRFVGVNEYWDGNTGSDAWKSATAGDIVPATLSWINGAIDDAPWQQIICFGHEPCFPLRDRHVGDSVDYYQTNRNNFWQSLADRNVLAFLNGHTHECQRFQVYEGYSRGGSTWNGGDEPLPWEVCCGYGAEVGNELGYLLVKVYANAVVLERWRDTNGDGTYAQDTTLETDWDSGDSYYTGQTIYFAEERSNPSGAEYSSSSASSSSESSSSSSTSSSSQSSFSSSMSSSSMSSSSTYAMATLEANCDTYILTVSSYDNFSTSTLLYVGDLGGYHKDILFSFDLTGLPAGAHVIEAQLIVDATQACSDSFPLYPLVRDCGDFTETTFNRAKGGYPWGTVGADNSITDYAGSSQMGSVQCTTTGIHTFALNATALTVINEWINTPSSNYGCIIKWIGLAGNGDLKIRSRENTGGDGPKLRVWYEVLSSSSSKSSSSTSSSSDSQSSSSQSSSSSSVSSSSSSMSSSSVSSSSSSTSSSSSSISSSSQSSSSSSRSSSSMSSSSSSTSSSSSSISSSSSSATPTSSSSSSQSSSSSSQSSSSQSSSSVSSSSMSSSSSSTSSSSMSSSSQSSSSSSYSSSSQSSSSSSTSSSSVSSSSSSTSSSSMSSSSSSVSSSSGSSSSTSSSSDSSSSSSGSSSGSSTSSSSSSIEGTHYRVITTRHF